jgi:LuxR family maltose regulon positive regulatory protein
VTEQATAVLEAGLEACVAAGVELTQVNVLGHLGLAAALTGRLHEAADWAGRCRALAEARGWAGLHQVAAGYLALALVSTARGQLEEADRLLSLGMETQRGVREPLAMLALRLGQAGVDVERGRYDDARIQVDRVRSALDPTEGPTLIDRWLARTEAEVDLATGAVAEVRARLEAVPAADRSAADTLLLARARLAEGEYHGVDRLLEPVVRQRRDLQLAVEASVVHALAADRLRMDNEALEALGRALAGAEPEHMLSPFTRLRTARLRDMLERTVVLRVPRAGFARVLLVVLDDAPSASMTGASVEALTQREQMILRYVATMRTNAEIADLMYISPNTVKVHLRNAYRKLGVASRRAGVLRARELGLLDDVPE